MTLIETHSKILTALEHVKTLMDAGINQGSIYINDVDLPTLVSVYHSYNKGNRDVTFFNPGENYNDYAEVKYVPAIGFNIYIVSTATKAKIKPINYN